MRKTYVIATLHPEAGQVPLVLLVPRAGVHAHRVAGLYCDNHVCADDVFGARHEAGEHGVFPLGTFARFPSR